MKRFLTVKYLEDDYYPLEQNITSNIRKDLIRAVERIVSEPDKEGERNYGIRIVLDTKENIFIPCSCYQKLYKEYKRIMEELEEFYNEV